MATAVHLGRTMATYEVVITDERGKRVCTSRITCALIPAANLRPDTARERPQPRTSPSGRVPDRRIERRAASTWVRCRPAAARHRRPLGRQLGAHERTGGHPQHGQGTQASRAMKRLASREPEEAAVATCPMPSSSA